MRIAVVTPVYRTPSAWLEQCLVSVARQTIPCVHFVVSDGDDTVDVTRFPNVQLIRLPAPHEDVGNAGRAIGSVSAIVRGFDAIAYLDADNWFESDHLQKLVELYHRSHAAVCTSGRNLVDLQGRFLGRCTEVDGETFVDTSCLFLTQQAFGIVQVWYRMPRAFAPVGDRIVWKAIKEQQISCAHQPFPTVNYRTSYRFHYELFGKPVPAGAKYLKIETTPNGELIKAETLLVGSTEAAERNHRNRP